MISFSGNLSFASNRQISLADDIISEKPESLGSQKSIESTFSTQVSTISLVTSTPIGENTSMSIYIYLFSVVFVGYYWHYWLYPWLQYESDIMLLLSSGVNHATVLLAYITTVRDMACIPALVLYPWESMSTILILTNVFYKIWVLLLDW